MSSSTVFSSTTSSPAGPLFRPSPSPSPASQRLPPSSLFTSFLTSCLSSFSPSLSALDAAEEAKLEQERRAQVSAKRRSQGVYEPKRLVLPTLVSTPLLSDTSPNTSMFVGASSPPPSPPRWVREESRSTLLPQPTRRTSSLPTPTPPSTSSPFSPPIPIVVSTPPALPAPSPPLQSAADEALVATSSSSAPPLSPRPTSSPLTSPTRLPQPPRPQRRHASPTSSSPSHSRKSSKASSKSSDLRRWVLTRRLSLPLESEAHVAPVVEKREKRAERGGNRFGLASCYSVGLGQLLGDAGEGSYFADREEEVDGDSSDEESGDGHHHHHEDEEEEEGDDAFDLEGDCDFFNFELDSSCGGANRPVSICSVESARTVESESSVEESYWSDEEAEDEDETEPSSDEEDGDDGDMDEKQDLWSGLFPVPPRGVGGCAGDLR